MNIAVFCSANNNIAPDYFRAAEELGRWIDEFYALPGGIGTIDEIFTVAASASIGYHHKKVTLVNVEGFWDSLIALLNDQQEKGMMRGTLHDYIEVKNIEDF